MLYLDTHSMNTYVRRTFISKISSNLKITHSEILKGLSFIHYTYILFSKVRKWVYMEF